MAGAANFFGWQRSGVYKTVPGSALSDGRVTGSVTLTVENTEPPGESVSQVVPFDVMGPGDVQALKPGAVVHAVPPPGTADAEKDKCVHVDLAAPDLPWRYTPQLASAAALRPWLALVVGPASQVALQPGGRVTIAGPTLAAHDPGHAARAAHVHQDSDHPERLIARLLSERTLDPLTEYVAVVVPAFTDAGVAAWNTLTTSITLPAYHAWRFETGEAGDFASLASKLRPGVAATDLGRAPLRYLPMPASDTLSARGALAPIGGTDASMPAAIEADVTAFTTPLADPRRPVVTAPHYGAAWVDDPDATTWGLVFRRDPRHRGIAGLGLRSGIDEQELLSTAAAAQAGALDVAAQRIRHLALGLSAARDLWSRRLPADPIRGLAIFGPSLARMMTKAGSVRDLVTGGSRPLPPALFSSAARRVLRPGPARARHAAKGAIDPRTVIERANACPPPAPRAPAGLPHADALGESTGTKPPLDDTMRQGRISAEALKRLAARLDRSNLDPALIQSLDRLIERMVEQAERGQPVPILDLVAILDPPRDKPLSSEELRRVLKGLEQRPPDSDDLLGLGKGLQTEPPHRPCTPVDLDELAGSVAAAIDPTVEMPFVVGRVLGTISGLDGPPLTPPELCPDLDIPAWQFLRDHAPDWLLPGAADLDTDSVVAVETNPTFVDAFLLGLNTQLLGELRFRNIPVVSGCTPARQFWARTNPASESYDDDIVGVRNWPGASALGSSGHQTPAAASADLVLVFRTPLFRRYPRTLVYLTPAPAGATGPDWEAEPDFANRQMPSFQGSITPEITFFGFDLDPELGAGRWVVLEEPPHGIRFFNTGPTPARATAMAAAADGGAFAAAAFADPIRVMIRGDSLIPEGA
jgi:hypothetical protein